MQYSWKIGFRGKKADILRISRYMEKQWRLSGKLTPNFARLADDATAQLVMDADDAAPRIQDGLEALLQIAPDLEAAYYEDYGQGMGSPYLYSPGGETRYREVHGGADVKYIKKLLVIDRALSGPADPTLEAPAQVPPKAKKARAAHPLWGIKPLSGDTCTLYSYKGSENNITIPAQVGPYRVVSVSSSAPGNKSRFQGCEKIVLSEGIVRIERFAFLKSQALREISLPDTLATLEVSAFAECLNLECIVLPEGVVGLAGGVFSSCLKLRDIFVLGALSREGTEARAFSGINRAVTIHGRPGSLAEEMAISSRLKFQVI